MKDSYQRHSSIQGDRAQLLISNVIWKHFGTKKFHRHGSFKYWNLRFLPFLDSKISKVPSTIEALN